MPFDHRVGGDEHLLIRFKLDDGRIIANTDRYAFRCRHRAIRLYGRLPLFEMFMKTVNHFKFANWHLRRPPCFRRLVPAVGNVSADNGIEDFGVSNVILSLRLDDIPVENRQIRQPPG